MINSQVTLLHVCHGYPPLWLYTPCYAWSGDKKKIKGYYNTLGITFS